jgi:hypothetical protein
MNGSLSIVTGRVSSVLFNGSYYFDGSVSIYRGVSKSDGIR